MFFYQTKDRLSYEEINTKTIQLFEKFIAQNGKSNPVEIDKGLVKIISVILNLCKEIRLLLVSLLQFYC
jgi:hypothetical protein